MSSSVIVADTFMELSGPSDIFLKVKVMFFVSSGFIMDKNFAFDTVVRAISLFISNDRSSDAICMMHTPGVIGLPGKCAL